MKNNHSIKSIQRMLNRRHALVPRNLDMTKFGDKMDKVAIIIDRIYRAKYTNDYGFERKRWKFTEPVGINMKYLTKELHESATPILDLICHSIRHKQNGTQPIEKVLVRVKGYSCGRQSAQYVLAKEYRDKPKIHRLQRVNKPAFKHDKDAMDAVIAGYPANYRKVCKHIKMLTLEMDEAQCKELLQQTREKYIQDHRETYIKSRISKLLAQHPKWSEDIARTKASTSWEKHSDKWIEKLDEENYDRLLFIKDKFLEIEGKDEVPIYALDPQGRLHYYLTNMPEELRPYIRLGGCKMVSYDLGTSQPVLIWTALREYITENNITLDIVKQQTDEIIDTIKQCNDGIVPDFVQEGFTALKQKRKLDTLDDEMKQFGKVLGKDFYADIMQTIQWQFDRKKFKTQVLFPFLYGKKPSWGKSDNPSRKTIMHYFLAKFPAVYCVLWRMRRFTEICLDFYKMTKDGIHYKTIKQHIDKTYNPAEFPKNMQRREADMFYNAIIEKINIPCVTIHDSIIVQSGKKCNVPDIIKKAFLEKYQIHVRVKCESWSK